VRAVVHQDERPHEQAGSRNRKNQRDRPRPRGDAVRSRKGTGEKAERRNELED
jgi:hypothetical protein